MVLNRYPLWKNFLVLGVIIIAFFYAAPNLYGDDPAVQISGANAAIPLDAKVQTTVEQALQSAQLKFKKTELQNHRLLVRFSSTDIQLRARDVIQAALGNDYLVALNLAPKTPAWLKAIGAMPMKYGLDLRGGIHLLMQVETDSVLKQQMEGVSSTISQLLRTERIRYAAITQQNGNTIAINFRTIETLSDAESLLRQHFPDFSWTKNNLTLQGVFSPALLQQAQQDILDKTAATLRNRVNELGVSEAIVTQQGATRIAVDLPGILDTAEAKNILGKTATLEFHLVDTENDARTITGHTVPSGTQLYLFNGQPVLLKNQIILHGSSIISARSGMGDDGRSSVDVRLGGSEESFFIHATAENIGKPMAILYVDIKPEIQLINGQKIIRYITERRLISVATIQSALGNSFQITGLSSQEEARTLALLLRAGALRAPVAVIEEREMGPSLGEQNIHKGVMSVAVGFLLIVLFMALYYRGMGLIADLALGVNLLLIVAILSLLGATLTLPGIAGIVLTVAMAADANVLIFERIREELRNGAGIQASIYAGYEKALVTIVDANITTLIVAIVLFSLGSSVVKSFAVTVTIGLLTSMFTAITGTRALVNLIYGGKPVKHISIGL
ncbi:MAG: secD [Gammaproteobacteria bacterium]|jgi:preprotein translocase subunit SecD|nr:secD [Gammaproteobacteria bacterium]